MGTCRRVVPVAQKLLLHCRAVAAALQCCACTATPGVSNVQNGCFHSHPSRNFAAHATVLCVYRLKSIEFLRFFRVLVCLVSCIMSPMRRGIIQAAGEAPGTPEHPGF